MLQQFHDATGQVVRIKPDLYVLRVLLETLKLDLQKPFLEQRGLESKAQLVEAALWINVAVSALLEQTSQDLLATENSLHNLQYVPDDHRIVCYWPDGYWIRDKSTAERLDELNAFEGKHSVVEVAVHADIDAAVRNLLNINP